LSTCFSMNRIGFARRILKSRSFITRRTLLSCATRENESPRRFDHQGRLIACGSNHYAPLTVRLEVDGGVAKAGRGDELQRGSRSRSLRMRGVCSRMEEINSGRITVDGCDVHDRSLQRPQQASGRSAHLCRCRRLRHRQRLAEEVGETGMIGTTASLSRLWSRVVCSHHAALPISFCTV